MKKILIPMILIALLFTASCSNSEVPKGYQAAHTAGEPFKLYVPKNWILNTAGGVSGAYISAGTMTSVSAGYYVPSDPEMTLAGYMDYCKNAYADTLKNFNITSLEETVLGGLAAQKLVYTQDREGGKFICLQISTSRAGLMISFKYAAPEKYYEHYYPEVEAMLEHFVVTGTLDYPNEEVTDKKTPEGMKIASASHLSFRMYVPKSWYCTPSDGGSSARYIAGDIRSAVAVTSFSPDNVMTAAEFAGYCETEYAKNVAGYNLIQKTDTEMAGKKAVRMLFGAEYDGFSYKILQVSVIHDEIAYSLTYTALSENFDAALDDAEKIIEKFEFR